MTDTHKQEHLEKRLSQAKKAIAENRICFAPDVPGLVEELTALEIDDSEEVRLLLLELFKEIRPDHYVKPHIPAPTGLDHPAGEFLGFIWKSKYFKNEMMIVFAINDQYFYYFSLSPTKHKK